MSVGGGGGGNEVEEGGGRARGMKAVVRNGCSVATGAHATQRASAGAESSRRGPDEGREGPRGGRGRGGAGRGNLALVSFRVSACRPRALVRWCRRCWAGRSAGLAIFHRNRASAAARAPALPVCPWLALTLTLGRRYADAGAGPGAGAGGARTPCNGFMRAGRRGYGLVTVTQLTCRGAVPEADAEAAAEAPRPRIQIQNAWTHAAGLSRLSGLRYA